MNPIKAVLLIIVVIIPVCFSSPAKAAYTVRYEGKEAGGNSELRYAYLVEAKDEEYSIMEFRVGAADLTLANYTNIQIPDGWEFDVEDAVGLGRSGTCTPIGCTAEPVKSLTPASIVWWTEDPKYAIDSFTFGFDHPWDAQDVGWRLITEKPDTFNETWGKEAPVGLGDGPVHSPCTTPEPATLLLLTLGATLLRKRNR
jgi:hypothetical protein